MNSNGMMAVPEKVPGERGAGGQAAESVNIGMGERS
jgi:hypothetical protein